jgi:hypothetical protein
MNAIEFDNGALPLNDPVAVIAAAEYFLREGKDPRLRQSLAVAATATTWWKYGAMRLPPIAKPIVPTPVLESLAISTAAAALRRDDHDFLATACAPMARSWAKSFASGDAAL